MSPSIYHFLTMYGLMASMIVHSLIECFGYMVIILFSDCKLSKRDSRMKGSMQENKCKPSKQREYMRLGILRKTSRHVFIHEECANARGSLKGEKSSSKWQKKWNPQNTGRGCTMIWFGNMYIMLTQRQDGDFTCHQYVRVSNCSNPTISHEDGSSLIIFPFRPIRLLSHFNVAYYSFPIRFIDDKE